MRIRLEVAKGTQAGKRFVFDRHETFMVGRSKKVHFQIPDDRFFSRHHFMIEVNPPECFLRDLGSTNGTFVNDEKVQQVHLKDGDVIRGGKTWIRVHVEEAPAEAEAAVSPERAAPQPVTPAPAQPAVSPPVRDRISMEETLLLAQRGELRCAICGRVAEDTPLRDLADRRMVTYVCQACRQERWDPSRPVPGFELIEKVGQGALGPVYKARRTATDRIVLLKVITPRADLRQEATKLFFREMQLSATLDHPNIVRVIEMGLAGRDLWVATDYVEGVDAARLARQLGGRVPLADAVDITCQTLDALCYAHGLNLVHRDVKPPNVMVSGAPGAYVARLSDFGLLRNMDEAGLSGITRQGDVRGTVPFMPPEQVLDCRFVKAAGDIYGAGATLYWLLTGQYVYDFEARDARGEVKDPFLVILEDAVVPVRQREADVPEGVAAAIEKSLEREPEDRFGSAAEMAAALRNAMR